jgi:hypothetical protein
LKVGGGLDVRVSQHVDARLIEFDYNPAFTHDRNARIVSGSFTNVLLAGRTAHVYTFGAGIVIH